MPRNGGGIYSLPSGYKANTGELIIPDQHNPPLEDIRDDLNAARPIVAGGTGANTASGARTNLSVYSQSETNAAYPKRVATTTALKALDTALYTVAYNAEKLKFYGWDATDHSGDIDNEDYIAADGIDPSLGAWVFVTGGAGDMRRSSNLSDLADAAVSRENLGVEIGADVQAHSSILDNTTASFTTAAETKLSGIEALADVTDATNVAAAGAVMQTATDASGFSFTVDEDDMASDSATLLPTQQSVNANIDLYAVRNVADRTALAASPATIIFSRDAADEKIWIKTSDDISAEITAADPRYLPTSGDATGASGGFYQAGSIGAGVPWTNIGGQPAAQIHRLSDRLMVGDGAVGYNGKTLSQDAGSWMCDQHTAYLLVSANIAGVGSAYIDGSTPTTGSIGIFGGARHNGSTGGGALGVSGFALNDGSTTDAHGWGGYFEAVREAGAGFTHGVEIDITNRAVSPRGPTAGTNPYIPFVVGSTHGLLIGCGGGDTSATLYNSDAAIGILNNGALHNVGIAVFDGALYRDGGVSTGRGHAMRLAANYGIEWYESTTKTLGATIVGNVTDAAHRQELRVDDNGLTLFNAAGKVLFRSLWGADAVNGIEVAAGATGVGAILRTISADDADASIIIRPKGAANGFLQGGTGSFTAMRWNSAGIGFFGASPAAKQSITGALSSVTDANAKAVLTSIISALSTSGLVTNSTT